MLIRLPADGEGPLYEQIAGAVRRAIVAGELGSNERLPSARELADALDVNLHTVLRAYAQLRDDGLIDVRRGRGATVRSDGAAARSTIHDRAAELVAAARREGIGRRELISLIERISA
ncbi:MAG: GntR family transcriptional regulator [Patulibacter sp.]|nr:GntR family transcriptional regulator [Patulibacter sp.]